MKPVLALAFLVALAAAGAAVSEPAPPPPPGPTGVIRVWGAPAMAPLLEAWSRGFRRAHPEVRVVSHLTGSDVGLGALYTGQADVALVGREAREMEVKAFQWVYGYPPTSLAVARGSADRPGNSPALAILVSRQNPIAKISLADLRRLFVSTDDLAARHTWGELGLTGAWARRPIHLYMPDAESGSGRFFRHAVLDDSTHLDWPALREFGPSPSRAGRPDRMWRGIADALARDPGGLAVGLAPRPGSPLKALPLAARADGPYRSPDRASVGSGDYALARKTYAYVNRPKGSVPLRSDVAAFLDYALSPAGQQALGGPTGYLPLPAAERAKSQEALR